MHSSTRMAAYAVLVLLPVASWAQASRTANGHWQGSLKMAGGEIALNLDLTKNQKGDWIGTFGMPAVGITDLPLSGLAVTENGVKFMVPGVPGTPSFEGKLSADGNDLAGTFVSGPQKEPLTFKRSGVAKVNLPPANSALPKGFEGLWQSALDGGPTTRFHLVLKLSRAADGTAIGTLTNIDRGNVESPLNSINASGNSLQFEIRALNGVYKGELNPAASEIKGEWKQLGNSAPLNFRRGASATSINSTLPKTADGTWRGTIDASKEYKIELVLKLSRAADGSATGTLSNSEANSRELPISAITLKGTKLEFEVGILKAAFTGTLSGNTLTGQWSQEGLVDGVPLTFRHQ